MTSIYQEIEETRKVKQLVRTVCDRCGEDLPDLSNNETRDFELKFSSGYSYNSSDYGGTGWCVEDVCDTCLAVLRTVLHENDFKIKEYDY